MIHLAIEHFPFTGTISDCIVANSEEASIGTAKKLPQILHCVQDDS